MTEKKQITARAFKPEDALTVDVSGYVKYQRDGVEASIKYELIFVNEYFCSPLLCIDCVRFLSEAHGFHVSDQQIYRIWIDYVRNHRACFNYVILSMREVIDCIEKHLTEALGWIFYSLQEVSEWEGRNTPNLEQYFEGYAEAFDD